MFWAAEPVWAGLKTAVFMLVALELAMVGPKTAAVAGSGDGGGARLGKSHGEGGGD